MKLFKVKQHFPRPSIPPEKVDAVVREQLIECGLSVKKGDRIAIATGSRGVANIHRIVKATVDYVKEAGGEPFIVPAMGSHGGATPEGQREVIEGYGITESYTGVPIKSSLEVVELPQDDLPNKVYMDKFAYEADGTIAINRVKVHTDYHGPLESGVMKMLVIGLGKHAQALAIHDYGTKGLKEYIPPTARQVLKYGNILAGIAIAENAYDETAIIEAWKPADIERKEIEMLKWVKDNMPSLPVKQIDVLIIDEFGKDISGVGLDPNIIGRTKIKTEPEPVFPDITSILLRDLTDSSHGNAIGMGLADIITRRVFEKIDFKATYENVVTSSFLDRGFVPIVVDDEETGLSYALRSCGLADVNNPRIIRIKNTLKLNEIWVSQAIADGLQGRSQIEVFDESMDVFAAY